MNSDFKAQILDFVVSNVVVPFVRGSFLLLVFALLLFCFLGVASLIGFSTVASAAQPFEPILLPVLNYLLPNQATGVNLAEPSDLAGFNVILPLGIISILLGLTARWFFKNVLKREFSLLDKWKITALSVVLLSVLAAVMLFVYISSQTGPPSEAQPLILLASAFLAGYYGFWALVFLAASIGFEKMTPAK